MTVGDFQVNCDFEKQEALSLASSLANLFDAAKGTLPTSEVRLKWYAKLLVSPSIIFRFGENVFVVVESPICELAGGFPG